jgi:hypothetical protein
MVRTKRELVLTDVERETLERRALRGLHEVPSSMLAHEDA